MINSISRSIPKPRANGADRGGGDIDGQVREGAEGVDGQQRQGAKTAHFCSMYGPHFCSMKITEDVRKFAAEQKISEDQALQAGVEQKAKEFVEKGSEVYAKA